MLTGTFDVAHICGKGNLDPTLDKTPGYTQVEFLDKERRMCSPPPTLCSPARAATP